MENIRFSRGFTLLEIGLGLMLLAVMLTMALNIYSDSRRASTDWVQGEFTLAPQNIRRAPNSALFVFAATRGTGVDENGQPVGNGVGLANRQLNFELIGSGRDTGIIQSLNTTTVNSKFGVAATDIAGIISISIQVDDNGPYILKVVDAVNGAEERHFFVADS